MISTGQFSRLVTWTLVLLLAVNAGSPGIVWAQGLPRGDLDASGVIDDADRNELVDFLVGRLPGFHKQIPSDFNLDGVVDVADVLAILNYDGDWDGDGVADALDAFPLNPEMWTSDLNGLPPEIELVDDGQIYGNEDVIQGQRTDDGAILPSGTIEDSDGDGLLNSEEDLQCSDSLLGDTDRDFWSDGPLDPDDTGGIQVFDGIGDPWPLEPDHDLDGFLDGTEKLEGTDPDNSFSVPVGTPDLTPAQVEILRQAGPPDCSGAKSLGTSGRGKGFSGAGAVGSGFESVQSDKFTGAFSYSIPIAVPPGRNGMQPNIDLLYRSSNGHSWLGQGWNLEVGRIERSTRFGVPKYTDPFDPSDPAPFDSTINTSDGDDQTPLDNPDPYVYLTSAGGNELFFAGTIDSDTAVYHFRVDNGEFARFLYHKTGDYWEIESKDGTKMFLGGNPGSNRSTGDLNSIVEHPTMGTFAWGLDESHDIIGAANKVTYQYQHPAGANAMYLQEIGYNYVSGSPKATIAFGITNRGADTTRYSYRESYRSGMKVVSEDFLTSITEVVDNRSGIFAGHQDRVRKYTCAYAPLDVVAGRTIACLEGVQEFGETDSDSYPPYSMQYTENAGSFTEETNDYSWPVAPEFSNLQDSLRDRGGRGVDINGDGLPDIWRRYRDSSGTLFQERLLNDGSDFLVTSDFAWTSGAEFANRQVGGGVDTGTRITDLDGDGLLDLIQRVNINGSPSVQQQLLNDGHSFQSTAGYSWPNSEVAFYDQFDQREQGLRAVDINGDGLTDLLQRYYIDVAPNYDNRLLNDGKGGFQSTTNFSWGTTYAFFYHNTFGPGGTEVADINGDGLADIWQRQAQGTNLLDYRLINHGTEWVASGNWAWDANDNMYFWKESEGDFGTVVADINGDGLADLWRRHEHSGALWQFQVLNTGNSLVNSNAYSWNDTNVVFSKEAQGNWGLQATDLNGDGLTDLWQRVVISGSTLTERRLLNDGPYPNLLQSIDNGKGGTVDIEYTAQTKGNMALYDPDSTRRIEADANGLETNNHIPYVIQCVTSITKTGLRPKHLNPSDASDPDAGAWSESYRTLYRYSGGQHLDREFRGFGKVKEIDAQTGNFTITEFHQDHALKGQIKCVRGYVGDRRDYRVDGTNDGVIRKAAEEIVPTFLDPKMVTESYTRYRVLIHKDDPNRLKAHTTTNDVLGDGDFPVGMTLVTPKETVTRDFEYYSDALGKPDYTQSATSSLTTAHEELYDTRGNLLQAINYGEVDVLTPTLDEPVAGQTFEDGTGANADGTITHIIQFETKRNGTWADVPIKSNLIGFHYAGETLVLDDRILQGNQLEYDAVFPRPIRLTQYLDTGDNPTVELLYDGTYGNLVQTTDPLGNTSTITYDSQYAAFVAARTNALGQTFTYNIDPGFGAVFSETDLNNRTRTASYDALGRLISRTNSAGEIVVSFEHYFFEDKTSHFVPNRTRRVTHTPTGDVWTEQHMDGLGRPYQTLTVGDRGPSDPVRVVQYFNDRGQVWKVSQPHWLSEADTRVGHNYRFAEVDALSFVSENDLDLSVYPWKEPGLNRLYQNWTELELTFDIDVGYYPSAISKTTVVQESPLATKTIRNRGDIDVERRDLFDAFGDHVGIWEADAGGSVGSLSAPTGSHTKFGIDALGRLCAVRRFRNGNSPDVGDLVTLAQYDTLSRRIYIDDPDSGEMVFRYDANGNVLQTTDARGVTVEHEYDALNRATRTSYPNLETGFIDEHLHFYDTGIGTNLEGRVSRIESPDSTIQFSYDDEGRTDWIRRAIDGVPYESASTFDYAGRITDQIYPDGMHLKYEYNSPAQLLTDVYNSGSGQVYLADKTYGVFGFPDEWILGNGVGGQGVTQKQERDAAGRVSRQYIEQTPGGTVLSDLYYAFDLSSNVTRIQEMAGPAPFGDMNYSYDSRDRLLNAYGTTMSGEDAGTMGAPRFAYDYDAFGRMIMNSRFRNGSYPGYDADYQYPADASIGSANQAVQSILLTSGGQPDVVAHTFTYDETGNILTSTNGIGAVGINDLDRSYTWDAFRRMASTSKSAGTTTYRYDHSNTRVKKIAPNGDTVVYVGDVMEVSDAGLTKHVFAAGDRIATIEPDATIRFYSTDHLSSSSLITDDSGSVVQRMDYEPYGAMIANARSTNDLGLRFTYTGQENDIETGLMYYDARYYDPVVGMFLSADTMVPSPSDPHAYNRYAYVRDNPMRFNDPTGHGFSDLIDGLKRDAKDAYDDARNDTKHFAQSAHQDIVNVATNTWASFNKSQGRSFNKRQDWVINAARYQLHDGVEGPIVLALSGGVSALAPLGHEALNDKYHGPIIEAVLINGSYYAAYIVVLYFSGDSLAAELAGSAAAISIAGPIAGLKQTDDVTSREYVSAENRGHKEQFGKELDRESPEEWGFRMFAEWAAENPDEAGRVVGSGPADPNGPGGTSRDPTPGPDVNTTMLRDPS